MGRKISFISDLEPNVQTSKIQVRVIRLWIVKERKSTDQFNSIEMLLLDAKGDKISVTVFGRKLFDKYYSKLIEGQSYTIQNFEVRENSGQYKITDHPYKISFHSNTNIQPLKIDIPSYSYTFIPFEKIINGNGPSTYLIDVKGELVHHEKISVIPIRNSTSKRKHLYLRDENNITIKCVLLGEIAEFAEKYIQECDEKSIIVIFQLAKIKSLKEGYIVTNSWNASKIIFNLDITEVSDLKKSLNSFGDDESRRFSEVITPISITSREDWANSPNKRTLKEIKQIKEICTVTTLATIKMHQTRFNWYYDSCNSCSKKVSHINDELWCFNCNKTPQFTIPKYKVQVQVTDPTDKASFVLFEREATQEIGKSVEQLHECLVVENDEFGWPIELDVLLNRTFLFRIDISKYNVHHDRPDDETNSFTVLQMSDDETQIQEFKCNSLFYQDNLSFNSDEVIDLNSIDYTTSKKRTRDSHEHENTSIVDIPTKSSYIKLKKYIRREKD